MDNNNQMNVKKELITLILADMRNRKLIMGLEATGLTTDDFNTNLTELIFEKMGIAKQHEVLMSNWYEDIIFNILDIDLHTFKEHQLFLAITFYDALKEQNRKLQTELMVKPRTQLSFIKSSGFKRFDN
jgi:hypothetical protein